MTFTKCQKLTNQEKIMEQQKVDWFIMTNKKYFPNEKIFYLRERLEAMSEDKYTMLSSMELKDPTTFLLVSLFIGSWGVDRFMLGDTGMGILKLLTGGCCGILTIVDWFTIQKKVKEDNFNRVMALVR